MKKLLLVSLCFLMFCITQVFAQNRTVTGTVTAKDDGLPMPGVSVKVKGTALGAQTNTAGKYSITVPDGAVLIFSFVGYETLSKPATGTTVDAVLLVTSATLGEVVVTGALGIKREAKEQGFAATQIDNKLLTEAHPTNFTNGLTAKAPGLVVSTVDNGINPETRFTLRGNRHINGNNYALVVLNGVPVSPNEVNTINPDDIESVNILNGAGAAALYGSEASNGALVITTKRGSPNGTPQISYTNNYMMESISYFPKLQTDFGSFGGEGFALDPITGYVVSPVPFENQSYGPRYNGQLTQLGIPLPDGTVQKYPYSTPSTDPREAFYQKGHSEENNVSYSSGDANNGVNISANRLDRTGVVPMDTYDRTSARVTAIKTSGILTLDVTAGFTEQNTSQTTVTLPGGASVGYLAFDAGDLLTTLLNTPSWVPLENYKNINAPFADQNTWFNSYGINPYWIINNSRTNIRSDAFNGSLNATLKPTKWFDANYRIAYNGGTAQEQQTRAEVDFSQYALSDPTGGYGTGAYLTGANVPGAVWNTTHFGDGSLDGPVFNSAGVPVSAGTGPQGYSRAQQDILVGFHKTFFDTFKTNLLLGNTIWEEYYSDLESNSQNLLVSNFYNIGSILGQPAAYQNIGDIRQIAFYGDLTLAYKDFAFVEGTLRNDHDSRLAAANQSFFYPSVKASLVITDLIPALKNNKVLSFLKLRASDSQVGDVNVAPYSINNTFSPTSGFPYGNTGGLSLNTSLANPTLKPEITDELEFGADIGFLDNRINGSVTYYDTHTKNQTLNINTSPATGYASTYINVGEVENSGMEFKLDIQALTKAQNGVALTLGGNFSIQNSKVISLLPGINQIAIGGYTNAAVEAVVGQPFPELVGTDINRDPQGHAIVDPNTGYPTTNPNLVNLGSLAPKYIMGLTQTVSYKFITLTAVEEYRTGDVIYNAGLIGAFASGTAYETATAGRQVFVFPNSVLQTGPNTYVKNTNTTVQEGNVNFWDNGSFYNAASTYVTSGAFWKLREADLSFNLDKWVKQSKFIKKASFSIIGRNLLMWRPKTNTWTDPEFAYSAGNNAIGINNTNQNPPTRLYGASLNVTF
jgi:TonB-linked SusC/RagA family outer membrane protein